MDEPLQELEAELKALTPRSVSSGLLDRIAHEMTAPVAENSTPLASRAKAASHLKAWRWVSLGGLGIAATLAFGIAIVRSTKHEAPVGLPASKMAAEKKGPPQIRTADDQISDDAYQPVTASNVLYEMKDEGPASNQGGSLERRVRYRYVDTYTWKNSRNNALLTWSVPRDEIRVQPAQFN